jgi:hypothetical protein
VRHRGALLGIALAGVVVGCNAFIGDWEVGEAPSASGASTGGSSTGEPAESLQWEGIAGGGVAIFREGAFRIETGPASDWQWKRWFYLAGASPDTPLGPVLHDDGTPYRTTCMWSASRSRYDDLNFASCPIEVDQDFADAGEPTLEDATPVAYGVYVSIVNGTTAEHTLASRVYASGRVWTYVETTMNEGTNTSGYIAWGEIAQSADHFDPPDPEQEGLLAMKGTSGAILSVDVGRLSSAAPAGTPGADWPGADGFTTDAGMIYVLYDLPLSSDDRFERIVPFHLGAKTELMATREARMADLRAPGMAATNATSAFSTAHGGVNPRTGAYDMVVDDATAPVSVTLTGSTTRFEPAFDVHEWTNARWTVKLDGAVIVSSEAQGERALGKRVGTTLSFQYLGVIEAGASEGARTFTVTAE